jgi:hypothetical protein
MEITRDSIKKYFKDRTNTVIFIILLIAFIYSIIIRFSNIGVLSYWGDDGQTFLGTSGILNYGYPKLPSGSTFYNSIFHFYLRVIPSLIFGINEIALRFPSAFFGALMTPLMFIFIKDLLNNKYISLLAAVIVSINTWQIEFSREIRYYSEYQFFYILSIYLFYRGFFKEEKNFKIAALVSIFLTIIISELGFTLIFLFIPLLIYKKFKGFFKKDIVISFLIIAMIIAGRMVFREKLLKAGLSLSTADLTSDTANPVLGFLSKYFTAYTPFYHRAFYILFPEMYYFVFFGIILTVLYLFTPKIRGSEENHINIYSNPRYSIKLPFNLAFLYFIFYSNTVFNGFGYMASHQRYIYHMNPIFIAIYCYIIFDIGRLASTIFCNVAIGQNKTKMYNKSKIPGKDIVADKYPIYLKKSVYFVTTAIIFFLTVNWANPINNFKIVYRNNGDHVASEFAPYGNFSFHPDIKTPGQYIYEHKSKGDVVIVTDLLNHYGYTRQVDYWLWTADISYWQPYLYEKDGKTYNEFLGTQVIGDLFRLYKVLNDNPDKNIWLITPDSIIDPSSITSDVAEFLNTKGEYKKAAGMDGLYSAYLFPEIDQPTRGFFYIPEEENIINVRIPDDNPFVIDFGNKENQPYLEYGWSHMERESTWADREYSVLFLNFEQKQDYTLTIDAAAFFDPEKKQEMKIILNGTEIGSVTFQSPDIEQYSFEIKKNLIETDGYNILEFDYKYQFNPKSLGISQDSRDLSVNFRKITIQKK